MNELSARPVLSGPAQGSGKFRGQAKLPWVKVSVFLLLHIPLAVAMKRIPNVAILQAWLTFFVGFGIALSGKNRHRIAYIGAYIAGSEVLWRMTNSSLLLPWEFGKYSISLIFIVSMMRTGRLNIPPQVLLYFVVMLPAALMTFAKYEWAWSRRLVSSNIAGPLALVLCVAFYSRMKLNNQQFLRLLIALMAPILGVATVCFLGTFGAAASVIYGRGSNLDSSGGFGPNQVSATLGLGMLAAFLCLIDDKSKLGLKVVLAGAAVWYAVQSALTLSRTGLYLAGASIALGCYYLIRSPRTRLNLILTAIFLAVIAKFVIFPRLDEFTNGALSARFKDTNMTNREEIALTDVMMFLDNPLLGVGMGQSTEVRGEKYGLWMPPHTEFSRLLSEHGLMGCTGIVLLLVMGWTNFRRARSLKQRALATSMMCFSMLFMSVSAMRLVLPSFTFGLAALVLIPDPMSGRLKKRIEPVVAPA